MKKKLNDDFTNYIDTIALKEQVFLKDGGRRLDSKSYSKNRTETGLELSFISDTKLNTGGYTIELQTKIYGSRLYKTPKDFVNSKGFHFQLSAPPALMKQQHSSHQINVPIKCDMKITIPSILELRKTDEWAKHIVSQASNDMMQLINSYILKYIPLKDLEVMEWHGKNYKEMEAMLKRDRDSALTQYVEPKTMELSQVDFCTNTINSDVSTFYNLLKYVGNYGTKNMKLYHNNIDLFDAEYTTGNYKDREQIVNKIGNHISTKANGLEFRRGSKSSQVVKFYDYTLKAMKYQFDHYQPIYRQMNETKKIEHLQKYYGKTPKEVAERTSTMRYEVSTRNIVSGNKGVRELYVKTFNLEDRKITIEHLFNKKYSSVVSRTLRKYLLNIFGDEITKEKQVVGEKSMDKWQIVKDKKLAKGLQIMAILQLMDGDNGMSLQDIKKKCIESGAGYESVRRIFAEIKADGYASNWNTDRTAAMNMIKEIYEELEKVK